MLTIKEIVATEKIEECWGLLSQHRDELATHKEMMVLKPDIQKYKNLEERGALFTLALYDEDKIIGYSVNVLASNIHYSDLLVSQNDILYVHPAHRKGRWGIKLISETERMAKERGATFIIWHGKEKTAFSDLMPRLGYGIQDILYSKVL